MHLGNAFTALLSWLSAKSRGGRWVLRIEDLDPQRSKMEFARIIEDDLLWLGLEWDEGGCDDLGPHAPYRQSLRGKFYETALARLDSLGLTYSCHCTRADIMATQAPHQSDGRIVYAGTCRPQAEPPFTAPSTPGARRIFVPDRVITFNDRLCGECSVNLAAHCGDFVLRRADGAWAYQLAVVVDDADMGVTEVMRGNDLLLSAAQQIYLYRLLALPVPQFAHLPLVCNSDGIRLSKRDASLSLEALRRRMSSQQLVGHLAHMAGLLPEPQPVSPTELIPVFSLDALRKRESVIVSAESLV